MKFPRFDWRDIPLARKLGLALTASVGAGLMLVFVAFSVAELLRFHNEQLRQLTTTADVIATNSRAALSFNDAKAGGETLASLHANSEIKRAALYNSKGELFASYYRHGNKNSPFAANTFARKLSGKSAVQGGAVGTVRFRNWTFRGALESMTKRLVPLCSSAILRRHGRRS